MARPSGFNDLDAWRISPDKIVDIDLGQVDLTIESAPVFAKVAELGKLLEGCGLTVKMVGSNLTATRAKSPAEMTRMLISEQSAWDDLRKRYLEAIEDPSSVTDSWRRNSIDRHAKNEGLPAIEWPAEEPEDDEEPGDDEDY